jgi:hypothetical protein
MRILVCRGRARRFNVRSSEFLGQGGPFGLAREDAQVGHRAGRDYDQQQ